MKKLVVAFASLLLPALALGQIESERNEFYLLSAKGKNLPNDSSRNWINLSLGYDLNSTAVTNNFTKALLFKGFIGDAEKDEVSSRLKSVNRAGYDFSGGITFKRYISPNLTLIGGIYERQQFNAKFTKDVFELIFRGNKSYAGKNADISPVKANYFDYQSLMIGAVKKIDNNIQAGAGISLIRGGRFYGIKIDPGTIYTDTAGTYLDISGNFQADYVNRNSLFSNGLGAGLNLFFSLKQDKGQLNVEVRDLGIIRWNKANHYAGNSTYRYEGVEVNDILSYNGTKFSGTRAEDIAADLGIQKEKKSVNYLIPATFHVSYLWDLSGKTDLVTGVKYMLNASYVPRFYVKGLYHLGENFLIVPTLAYGGFGKADIELGIAKSFQSEWVLSANAFYLEYLLLPKHSSGNGFNLSVTKIF